MLFYVHLLNTYETVPKNPFQKQPAYPFLHLPEEVVAVLMRILKPDYVEPEKVEENLDDIEDIDLDIEIF